MALRCFLILQVLVVFTACDPSDEKRLSIIAGGDCLLDRYNGKFTAKKSRDARWADLVRVAAGNDAFLINLETTVGTGGSPKSKRFVFRAPPDELGPLAKFPRPIVALANNHSLDYGPEGLLETIHELDRRGIAHVGAGKSRENSLASATLEKRGTRIRILSFGFDNETASYSGEEGACIAPLHLKQMITTIASNRASADFIVVMLHWGREYETQYTGYQAEIAHSLIKAGADAILGTGPHVLQGIELYQGSLICYSLGNLVFDDLGDTETTASIIVRITCASRDGHEKKSFAIMPLRTRDIVHGPSAPDTTDALAIIHAIAERSPDPSIISQRPHKTDTGLAWFRILPQ